MYNTLRANISINDLVSRASSLSTESDDVKRLMNLIMQLRKVCNHPELFVRADVSAPFSLVRFAPGGPVSRDPAVIDLPYSTASPIEVSLPKLVYRAGLGGVDEPLSTDTDHLHRLLRIWSPEWMHTSLKQPRASDIEVTALTSQARRSPSRA